MSDPQPREEPDTGSAAPVPPGTDVEALVADVEGRLLGGERRYTRVEVAERAGISLDDARAMWRALGFATVTDEDRVFTDADVEAMRNVQKLKDIGDIDDDVMLAMTRIIGQTFARLASWQGQLVIDILARSPEMLGSDADTALDLVNDITPVGGELHDYVWRRQLAAYFSRVVANASGMGDEVPMAVGFVDMAGFTTFTRRASDADLRAVLERFETLSTDTIAASRGQVVKTIGDEVLFSADTPHAAAEIALALIEAADADDTLPELRAGVAHGAVVRRLGDVYGQTVNIASRLTSVARTGSVLVDEGMADALRSDDDYRLSPLRPVSVRGYHHLRSWRLRRTGD